MADLSRILLSTTPQAGLQSGLQTGEQLAGSFERARANSASLEAQKARERLAEQQAQRAQALAPSQLQTAQAQASQQQFKAKNPLLSVSSNVNPMALLDYVGTHFGYQSPEYTQLEKYQQLQNAATQSNIDYHTAIGTNYFFAHSPATAKTGAVEELSSIGYPISTIDTLSTADRNYIFSNKVPYNQWLKQGSQRPTNELPTPPQIGALPPSGSPAPTSGLSPEQGEGAPQSMPSSGGVPQQPSYISPEAQAARQIRQNTPMPSPDALQNAATKAKWEDSMLRSTQLKSALPASQQNMVARTRTALQQIGMIEPKLDSFGKYLALSGNIKRRQDMINSMMGMAPSQDFLNYQNTVQGLTTLANEFSQAVGAAKTKEEQEKINQLMQPKFWQNIDDVKSNIAFLKNVLIHQHNTVSQPLADETQRIPIAGEGQAQGTGQAVTSVPSSVPSGAPITVPSSVNTPAQYKNWINALPIAQQIQFKRERMRQT